MKQLERSKSLPNRPKLLNFARFSNETQRILLSFFDVKYSPASGLGFQSKVATLGHLLSPYFSRCINLPSVAPWGSLVNNPRDSLSDRSSRWLRTARFYFYPPRFPSNDSPTPLRKFRDYFQGGEPVYEPWFIPCVLRCVSRVRIS